MSGTTHTVSTRVRSQIELNKEIEGPESKDSEEDKNPQAYRLTRLSLD